MPKTSPFTTKVLGHAPQREMLQRLLAKQKLPSAMLFAGSAGIGKKMVARELAASLFCLTSNAPYGGCGDCKHCHQVTSGNVPDLIYFDCGDKERFDLDALRGLLHTISLRPFLGGARLVLLDNAESLSVQSSNLLLKSLEEPRPENFFILICSNPAMLPPTLLSRCQIWFFDRLSEDEIRGILTAQHPSGNLAELTQLADGSLAGLSALQEQLADWHSLSADLSTIHSGDVSTAIALAAELSKQKDHLRAKLGLLRVAARGYLIRSIDAAESFRWSTFILDVLTAERLIFDRNLGANYVLSLIFSKLADRHSFTRTLGGARLLDHVAI